jgi:hypothetical protein
MNTEKLTILYDAKREGRYKIDIVSISDRKRHNDAIDLVNEGYLKMMTSRSPYIKTFKITPKGSKYIKDYELAVKYGDKLPYYMLA